MENILFESMVSIVQMLVFTIYLKDMLGLRRSVYWMPVYWGLIEIIHRVIGGIADSAGANGIIYFLLIEIITFWMCSDSCKTRFFVALTYVAVVEILEIFFINIIVVLKICDFDLMISDVRVSSLILLLIQIFLFVFFQIIIYCWRRQKNYEISTKNWLGILLVSGGCLGAALILIVNMINNNDFSVSEVAVLIILIILNFLSYYFYSVSAEKYRVELETAVYQEQINMYRERYEGILQTRKEIADFQHDMNNHFGVLQKLCQEGKERKKAEECISEIEEYLEKAGIVYDRAFHDINSENLIIDSVIGMKKGYAMLKGIEMKTELYIPSDMVYDSMDLVVILGNLLDNAIEACERLAMGQKSEIILKIKYKMSNLVIHTENTYEGKKEQSGSSGVNLLPQTTKENRKLHGIGMKNVKKVVEKYNGLIEWRSEQGTFFVDVLLFGFDKKKIEETKEK